MKKHLLIWAFLCLSTTLLYHETYAQKKSFLLSGTVKDAETNAPLENANILFSGLTFGTQTDSTGKFSIFIPATSYQIVIRMLGYKIKIERFTLNKNTEFDFLLEKSLMK
jgi:hypothetical protein